MSNVKIHILAVNYLKIYSYFLYRFEHHFAIKNRTYFLSKVSFDDCQKFDLESIHFHKKSSIKITRQSN